jgi:hypothetical protein
MKFSVHDYLWIKKTSQKSLLLNNRYLKTRYPWYQPNLDVLNFGPEDFDAGQPTFEALQPARATIINNSMSLVFIAKFSKQFQQLR